MPAVRLVETVPAVAVKVDEAAPAGTVTNPGTGSSLVVLDRATTVPPANAGWFSETVQVDEAPPLSEVGLHESPLNVGNGTVMAPPVPVTEIGPPAAVVATGLVSPTEALSAEVVIVTVIVATTPFCISVSFSPDSKHV
ncbi:MAG: hypothetical protein ABSB23_16310 [Bryobacteraceae bacterium]|jgi:hypothetical protein